MSARRGRRGRDVDGRSHVAGCGWLSGISLGCGLRGLVAIRLAVGLVRLLFAMTQNILDVCVLTADHEVGPDAVAFRDVGRMAVALSDMAAAAMLTKPFCIGDVEGSSQTEQAPMRAGALECGRLRPLRNAWRRAAKMNRRTAQ